MVCNDQIYLYAKDPYRTKNQFLINKLKVKGLSYSMILNFLFDTQMVWTIYLPKLNNTIQIKNAKH